MAPRTRFQHDHLPGSSSFRVVELLPGRFEDDLDCHIITQNLTDHGVFEAVSYVWGSEEDMATMSCRSSEIHITRNLEAALRRFRYTDKPRTLWTDSVCIDQANTAEKNHQVGLMGQIYRRAERVLIWLGEEDSSHNLQKAIQTMKMIEPLYDRRNEISAWNEVGMYDLMNPRNFMKMKDPLGLQALGPGELAAIAALWKRPWFSRAWTFQESFLAKERRLYCGPFDLDIDYLQRIHSVLRSLMRAARDPDLMDEKALRVEPMIGPALQDLTQTKGTGLTSMHLLQLLRMRRGSQCKYPSDLVYSLLGSTPDGTMIDPDYEKPFERVFAEATMHIINKSGDLTVLGDVCRLGQPSDLPTWIADWRIDPSTSPENMKRVFDGNQTNLFHCTGSSKPQCSLSADYERLTLRGFEFDRIEALQEKLIIGDELETFVLRFIDLPKEDTSFMYRPNETLHDALYRIMCTNLAFPDVANPETRWTGATTQIFKTIYQDLRLKWRNSESWAGFSWRLAEHCMGSKPMITHGKRIGVAPSDALPGDIIALMLGGNVPLLLRPSDSGYQFIGECFVDEIIDGEALQDPLLPHAQDFVLV